MWLIPFIGVSLQLCYTIYSKLEEQVNILIPKLTNLINNKCHQYISQNNIDSYVLVDEEYVPSLHLIEIKSQPINIPDVKYSESINFETYILNKNLLTKFYIISTVSCISLAIIKMFMMFNCVPELIIGLIVGYCVQRGFNLRYGRYLCLNEIQKLLPYFVILPIILVIVRNILDTYIIGLLIFKLSSVTLYITQVFAMYFTELLRITNIIYPNKYKTGFTWFSVIIMTLFL